MVITKKGSLFITAVMIAAALSGCGLLRKGAPSKPVPETAAADAEDGQKADVLDTAQAEEFQVSAGASGMEQRGEAQESGEDLAAEEGTETNAETADGTETEQEGRVLPWMVMVNSELYVYSGELDDETLRCGMMDGEISLEVPENEIPTQNHQSNFGTGYGYQYGAENEIQVHMPCDASGELHWLVFRKSSSVGGENEDIFE